MAFERILARIRQIKADIINNRERDMLRIALDQVALIKLRIQTSGKNANGNPFAPYDPNYSKQRQKAGYQVGFVDYTRTGQFWAGIRPRVVSSDIFQTTVQLESDNPRGEDILAGAEKKRGNLLTPSKEEIEFVRTANKKRLEGYLKF